VLFVNEKRRVKVIVSLHIRVLGHKIIKKKGGRRINNSLTTRDPPGRAFRHVHHAYNYHEIINYVGL